MEAWGGNVYPRDAAAARRLSSGRMVLEDAKMQGLVLILLAAALLIIICRHPR